MPILKINPPQQLDPKYKIPWHAATHTLTLCDRHLTDETLDRLINHTDDLIYAGGGIFATHKQDVSKHYRGHWYTVYFTDSINISDIPKDLRECIHFAANLGFNAISFEPYDPEDCPVTEYLKIYR